MLSVLEQKNQANCSLEYMVVDGGSNDGSLEIIQRYAGDLAWWVSEPDAGQAEAINKGLQRARGEYVAWLNSDDLYLPGAVAQAVQALEADPDASIVFADAITIDAQGRKLNDLKFGDWGIDELMRFRIICQPAVFMRRSALERAGYLDLSFHYLLDHHLWLRLAQQGAVRHAGGVWAAARHHPQAKNVAHAAGFGREAFRILEWMQTQPELASRLAARQRRILAGAHRLNARYLLDGDQPGQALRAYLQALRYDPAFALQHWHRMAYAVFSIIFGSRAAQMLRRAGGAGGSPAQ